MPEIPRTVKVGGHVFRLEFDAMLSTSDQALGQFEPSRGVIRIDSAQPLTVQKEALLHELLHAAYWLAGSSRLDGKSEETVIRGLQSPLYAIFKENKELTRWLIS